MKTKRVIIIVIISLLAIGIGSKYAYDSVTHYAINKALSALKPEMDAYIKENGNTLPDDIKAALDEKAEDIKNTEKSDNQQATTTPTATAKTKEKNGSLTNGMSQKDIDRAIQIGTSVISLERATSLWNAKTPEAKKELKDAWNKLSSAQKQELINIYSKYSK